MTDLLIDMKYIQNNSDFFLSLFKRNNLSAISTYQSLLPNSYKTYDIYKLLQCCDKLFQQYFPYLVYEEFVKQTNFIEVFDTKHDDAFVDIFNKDKKYEVNVLGQKIILAFEYKTYFCTDYSERYQIYYYTIDRKKIVIIDIRDNIFYGLVKTNSKVKEIIERLYKKKQYYRDVNKLFINSFLKKVPLQQYTSNVLQKTMDKFIQDKPDILQLQKDTKYKYDEDCYWEEEWALPTIEHNTTYTKESIERLKDILVNDYGILDTYYTITIDTEEKVEQVELTKEDQNELYNMLKNYNIDKDKISTLANKITHQEKLTINFLYKKLTYDKGYCYLKTETYKTITF